MTTLDAILLRLEEINSKAAEGKLTMNTPTIANAANPDIAAKTVETPFLNASDIAQRLETDGKTVVYDVIGDEKVLFSTVSAPLAHSFISGWNAKGDARHKDDAPAKGTPAARDDASQGDDVDANNGNAPAPGDPTPIDTKALDASVQRKRYAL
jgi:hypothetical protein